MAIHKKRTAKRAVPKKSKATKKSRPQNYGGKSSFILSFPSDTPAAEIVAAGAAKGLKFAAGYVSTIRSLDRKRRAKANGSAPAKGKPGRKPKAVAAAPTNGRKKPGPKPKSTSGDDDSIVQIILRFGVAKVEEALARVKAFR